MFLEVKVKMNNLLGKNPRKMMTKDLQEPVACINIVVASEESMGEITYFR